MPPELAALKPVLKRQKHAALAMLGDAIRQCPDDVWTASEYKNAFWLIAYHTLYCTHMYLQPDRASFRPWRHHKDAVLHPDGRLPAPEANCSQPFIQTLYTKAQLVEYWEFCDGMVDNALDNLDLGSSQSGFSWYQMSKLELLFVSLRHIQHHAGQLADRLRSSANIGIQWRGGDETLPV